MASFLPDTDSEDEMPPGWEERVSLDGRVYYAHHQTQTTQWEHPKSGKKKKVNNELPYGWEEKILEDGKVIYYDRINNQTSVTDPRLAFAVEDRDSKMPVIKQRFDASSTALQVLHGRDLSGKVAIVTGGNCGIGYETCRALAFHGCHVIMACRDVSRAQQAIEDILNERDQCKLQAMKCDLSNLRSVENFVEEFKTLKLPLNYLILNAGVFALPHGLTPDGFEQTFQINHLSHFYLTKLLLEELVLGAPSRVVVVSSESHRFSYLNADNISEERLSPKSSSGFIPMIAYNDSKLCNVAFSRALNRRMRNYNVTSHSVHPGNMISTSLSRNWWVYRLLFAFVRPFTKSLEQGAACSVFAATAQEYEGIGGMYFNNCIRCMPSKTALDEEFGNKLWKISETMIQRADPNAS